MCVGGLKVEGMNLWIGSLISVFYFLSTSNLLIWWLGLRASLIFCLFPPLVLIAFGFFFSPKDSLCDKADFSAHSGFNEPPGCRCDTKEACWSALLCQAQQNSIPSSEPLFRLLGRQYVGAFIWRTNLAHTLLCLCVCGTGYVCPSRLIPLISQCQGGALITRLNHVCRKNPERWLSVSVIVGCDIYIHKRLLPRVISLLPYLFP